MTSDSRTDEMERYVDELGDLRISSLRKEDAAKMARAVLNELDEQTSNLADMESKLREESAQKSVFDKGYFSKMALLFYVCVVKELISGVLVPFFDIFSDAVTAAMHAYFGHFGWAALTLLFVLLPGFVAGVSIAVWSLRKEFTLQRLVNFSLVVVAMPILYPIIQILVNGYMLFLMVLRRSRHVVRVMGHDVKQFKSLEGFLESGPQFVLQAYILLRGQRRGYENLDETETNRLMVLLVSVVLSFFSLTKTGFNVNRPDPSDSRSSPQYPSQARYFALTSLLFHLICVLFRVSCLAYFFATLRHVTYLVLVVTVLTNVLILHHVHQRHSVSFLLGLVSVFVPNGYLLHNFAATLPVDLSFEATKKFLIYHMSSVTSVFMTALASITAAGLIDAHWLDENVPDESILHSITVQMGINAMLFLLGTFSIMLCIVHWMVSIRPLYKKPREGEEEEEERQGCFK